MRRLKKSGWSPAKHRRHGVDLARTDALAIPTGGCRRQELDGCRELGRDRRLGLGRGRSREGSDGRVNGIGDGGGKEGEAMEPARWIDLSFTPLALAIPYTHIPKYPIRGGCEDIRQSSGNCAVEQQTTLN